VRVAEPFLSRGELRAQVRGLQFVMRGDVGECAREVVDGLAAVLARRRRAEPAVQDVVENALMDTYSKNVGSWTP
jgi:hypothetical protein